MILNELKKAREKKYTFILTGEELWFCYSYTVYPIMGNRL